jgi:serine/threonine protein kinase
MGIVYKARDMTLDRDVALKMMDAQLAADQNFLKRFQSEAKALAKLQNPGIVTIHALRETELGLCIVMEFVEGQTLADVIRERGPVPAGETIPLFKQILSALDHAHRAGIIHRDIKPSNVMITPEGAVKVADFGLAKIQQTSAVTEFIPLHHDILLKALLRSL